MKNWQRYPEYKDSGVEWLGEIPKHWYLIRLKYIAPISSKKLTHKPDNLPYIGLEHIESKTGKLLLETPVENVESTVSCFELGNVLFGKLRPYLAKVLLAEFKGVSTTELLAFKPTNQIVGKFLFYQLIAEGFIDQINSLTYGTKMPRVSPEQITNLSIPIPSLPEQKAIAHFLDRETNKLDNLIAKKERFIELLQEKRTALISHAVTKGLNPDVPMKDSGISWLGQIPQHWEVKKLRYIGYCQNGVSKGSDYFGSGYPFVNYTDVYSNLELPQTVSGLAKSTDSDRINYSVQAGDVFFTRTSETIEEIGIASTCLTTINDAIFSGFLIRFRPFANLLYQKFSKYYFRCQQHRFFFVKEMNIVTRASLSQELLKRLPVLLPPISEQKAIAQFLDRETAKIDTLIEKTKTSIEKLKEYRTALISAAVTGKIDIRQEII